MEFLFRIAAIFLALLETAKGEYGDRIKNATITWGGNLVMEESRHAAYAVQRPASVPVPGYAPHTELPITFKAPYVNARDYWTESSRRTVLDYVPYSPQDLIPRPLNDGINSFYDLMQQFFGADDPQQRYRRPQPPPPPPRQPYEFENPYHQRPSQPYYLPRPKPLQASIQKLEPNPYASQQYNNYPQFVKIVNDVLVENAYRHPEPVIEKPAFILDHAVPPTTYKPKSAYHARPQVFPVSIQDQLPPAHPGQDTRIPYVTSSPITTTPETTTVQWPVGVDTTPGTRVVFPAPTEIVPLDIAIDVRNAGKTSFVKRPVVFETTTVSSTPEITTPEVPTTISMTTARLETETRTTTRAPPTTNPPPTTQFIETTRPTTTTEKLPSTTVTPTVTLTTSESPATTDAGVGESHLLNTVEPLEELRFGAPFPKKLELEPRKSTTDSTTPSADYVTDLTVQGLSDLNAIHASIPQHSTPFNGSLIGYVLEKYNATAPPPKVIPIDDGLSLDAKILRDTNWDGYQPVIPTTDRVAQTTIWTTTPAFTTPTTETPTTTTYIPEETTFVTTEPTPVEKEKETAIISSRITFSQSARQRHRNRETTTQEVIITPRTDEVTIPNDVSPTSPSTTTRRGRKYDRRHRVQNQVQYSRRRHDDDDLRSSEQLLTSTTETTSRRRKYHRRQRVHNFTQFSDHKVTTPGPIKLGTLTRPFHPKRTRPNVTLTFKRNSKRVQEVSSTIVPIESKTLSGEELVARRNLYNRRKSTSHVRSSREREDQSEPFVDE